MNSLSLSLRISAALLLTCTLQTASAEIYKWTDADGNVHYTQTPPQGENNVTKDVKDIAKDIEMAVGAILGSQDKAGEAENLPADTLAAARQAGAKNTIKHQAFCTQQESALKQLLANPVIRWNSDGDERVLTATERQTKIDEFSNNLKEMCNEDVLTAKSEIGAQ